MTPTLTHSRTGDVAVVAVTGDAAIRFLCRSLRAGSTLAGYRAVLIDLSDVPRVSAMSKREIERTTHVCLARHQWLGIVSPGEDVARAVRRARRWLRLLEGTSGTARASARSVIDVVAGLVSEVARR